MAKTDSCKTLWPFNATFVNLSLRVFCMADIPTVYQKRSPEITIVSADIKDDDGNAEVKKLPMSSGGSGTVWEAGELISMRFQV